MFLGELNKPITSLRGVGPIVAANLSRLGIYDIKTLLRHYPRDMEDRSIPRPLKDWNEGRVCTEVEILAHDWIGQGRKKTLKIHVEDDSARAALICFNRPFMQRQFPVGERFKLYGQFQYKFREIQAHSFELESLGDEGLGPILPIYPLTEGLSRSQIRKLMNNAVKEYAQLLSDELPESIINKNGLLNKKDAIKSIHFPSSMEDYALAMKTLIYEELFYFELMLGKRLMQRKGIDVISAGPGKEPEKDNTLKSSEYSPLQKRLLERLPFDLTNGQDEAIKEINNDIEGPYPMARLLQGDVGSGKTLVSFLAAIRAVEKGGQAALLAPTELLARQHAENAGRYLEPLGLRLAFLTGNLKPAERERLLENLAEGEIDIIAGTHALFSSDVTYKNLSFVTVDEQHRFGVLQRQAITAKGNSPDLLMMSSTPIPRSLALTVFGDLDVSVIRDLPPGRKPVKTHLAKESNEQKVYDFVRKELEKGFQAYFVYPLIENLEDDENAEDEEGGLKDAVNMYERLGKEVFPGLKIALLHSKVDEEVKRKTMESFRSGEIKILVATSVVEVGVDVPNASIMVIEHAERFGLSALHQLRGRVGRGSEQSYCFLVYSDNLTEIGKQRLRLMHDYSDGFIIAEEDLKLRGPGQLTGIEQSGYLKLGIADPIRDSEELLVAREDAFMILEKDPGFEQEEYRIIAEVLNRAPHYD